MWYVLKPARRAVGWSGEVEEMVGNEASERVRSRGHDMTMFEFWKHHMESEWDKGVTGSLVDREEPRQDKYERQRDGGRGDDSKAWFSGLGTPAQHHLT